MNPHRILLLLLSFIIVSAANAQYILNGDAQQISCNCYTLTPQDNWKGGSVWNSHKINLSQSFDFSFNVFLGCHDDNGADGIVFILQPISTSIGTTGEGMGFDGIKPSIGIALDTYQNTNLNDPAYDHISIQRDGLINHSTDLAAPMPISASSNNVEDCKWHVLRISWDAGSHWLKTYFDGVLRVQTQIDLVNSVFSNDPNVYWGFSGATGGLNNLQQFCTALNPDFKTNLPNDAGCAPASLQFNDQSVSFAPIASYLWKFGDGDSSTSISPQHTFSQPGSYLVNLSITALDGCAHDTLKTITIGSIPSAAFNINDTCQFNMPDLQLVTPGFGVRNQWELDGSPTAPQPDLSKLSVGTHTLKLTASSLYNCGVPATAQHAFRIKPVPSVGISLAQLCKDFDFTGIQTDNQSTITKWNWSFGDGAQSDLQQVTHSFSQFKTYKVSLVADAGGCLSSPADTLVTINQPYVFAGNDTVLMRNKPGQLHGSGNGPLQWQPSIGLSSDTSATPLVILNADQSYSLTVQTNQGCTASSFVNVRVYDGPQVYMPNAFTPNGDGLNDVLKPVYVGMAKLEQFSVFNRWGQAVFTTSDPGKGWDGKLNQKPVASGTYVWMIKATDYLNQPVFIKGTVTIIQ